MLLLLAPTVPTSTAHHPPPSLLPHTSSSPTNPHCFSQAQLASLSSELEASQLQLRTAQAAAAEAVTAASASAAVAAQVRATPLLLARMVGVNGCAARLDGLSLTISDA